MPNYQATGPQRKATVRAGSNIAFVKYWGVNDPTFNLPQNSSISMTLADLATSTTVEWDTRGSLPADEVTIDGEQMMGKSAERVTRHLERMRALANVGYRARVVSQNNFPRASGIASSASGFAALTVAGCSALGLRLDNFALSRWPGAAAARPVAAFLVGLWNGIKGMTTTAVWRANSMARTTGTWWTWSPW